MFKHFTLITNSQGVVEIVRLKGFSDTVAHKILASDGFAGREIVASQVFEDLAYMTKEALLANSVCDAGLFDAPTTDLRLN